MSILHYQIYLQRRKRVTAPGSVSRTTPFVAFGITSYSLEIGPDLCPPASDAGLVTLSTRNYWESRHYTSPQLHLPCTEGRNQLWNAWTVE